MNHMLIAGGGIGGLSAAISLRKAGFSVTLCEAALENPKNRCGDSSAAKRTGGVERTGRIRRLL